MKNILLAAGILASVFALSGCVATAPIAMLQDRLGGGPTNEAVARLSAAIDKSDANGVGDAVTNAIGRENGPERIKELFQKKPQGKALLKRYYEIEIADISNAPRAGWVQRSIANLRQTSLIDSESVSELEKTFDVVIVNGNLNGRIGFVLDDLQSFPQLAGAKSILADRTIQALDKMNFGRRMSLDLLVTYAKQVDPKSEEWRRLRAGLLSINVTRKEVDLFEPLSDVYEELRKRLFIPAHFQMRGGDRLAADDMLNALRARVEAAVWQSGASPEAVSVTVERIRHDEKAIAEQRESVTYAQHEVNLISAALLMPRNASYHYDVIRSGAAIDYGYVVIVEGRGPRFEEVVRGTATAEIVRCSNARIQNVFGGVTSAGFVANQHMEQLCRGGNGKSVSVLREEIFEGIAAAISRAPQFNLASGGKVRASL